MKKGDFAALLFFILYVCAVFFFPWSVDEIGANWAGFAGGTEHFGKFTAHFPYLMGFFKVGLLATFGEMLKHRMLSGSWKITSLPLRFFVWGVTGVVFTFVFALFAAGVRGLMGTPLWFGDPQAEEFGMTLLFAFSTSFWMNMTFAYPMMLGHEWCNEAIRLRRFIGGKEFLESLNKGVWGSFIPKTILFFWIPAHTVTFCLPPNFRVLMSAVLSLVLGAILTFRTTGTKKTKKN